MSKPKSITPSLELDTLLDTDFNTKEAFLKNYALYADEIQASIETQISILTLEKLKASDKAFADSINKLTKALSAAKARRTKLIQAYTEMLNITLKQQGLLTPASSLYVAEAASVKYDLTRLEEIRTSPYYNPSDKGNVESLLKSRRSELTTLLKALIPATKPVQAASSNDPLSSIL